MGTTAGTLASAIFADVCAVSDGLRRQEVIV